MPSFSFSIKDKQFEDILKEWPLIFFLILLVELLYNINLSSPLGIMLLEVNANVFLSIFIPPINGDFSIGLNLLIWELKSLVIL